MELAVETISIKFDVGSFSVEGTKVKESVSEITSVLSYCELSSKMVGFGLVDEISV